MKQEDLDLLLARAQVVMAFLFAVLIFALLFVLIFLHDQISGAALTIITSVIASLITVLTLQQNFFYARQRPAALPDPTLAAPGAPTLTVTATNLPPTAQVSAATTGVPDASRPSTSPPASPRAI